MTLLLVPSRMKTLVPILLALAPLGESAWPTAEVGESALASLCVATLADQAPMGHIGDSVRGLIAAIEMERGARTLAQQPRRRPGLSAVVRPDGAFPFFAVAGSELESMSDAELAALERRLGDMEQETHRMAHPSEVDALAVGPVRIPAVRVRKLLLGAASEDEWERASARIGELRRSVSRARALALGVPATCAAASCAVLGLKVAGTELPAVVATGLTSGAFVGSFLLWAQVAQRRERLAAGLKSRGELAGEGSLLGLEASSAKIHRGPFAEPEDVVALHHLGATMLRDARKPTQRSTFYYVAGVDRSDPDAPEAVDLWLRTVPGQPDKIDVSLFVRALR